MKRKNILLVGLFMMFVGVNNVNAMTLKPSGDTSGKIGDNITIYITLEKSSSEKEISAVDGVLSYDDNVLELTNTSYLLNNWTKLSDVSNGKTFSYGNLTFDNLINKTSQNIIEMVFKIKDNANYGNTTITISSPSATDNLGDGVTISGASHNVKVLSDVNTLSNITISNGLINFNENTTEYNLTIDSDVTTITATKKDSASSVSGDIGIKSLEYGLNTFKITVTSESGKNKVYTLNITRNYNKSSEKDMLNFEFIGYSINYNKNTTEYNLTIENDVSKLAICSESKENILCINDKLSFSEKSSVEYEFNNNKISNLKNGEYTIKEGKNVLTIKVTAENETQKVYTFNIDRKKLVVENESIETPENPETSGKIFIIMTICLCGTISLILTIHNFEKRKSIVQK